MTETHAEHPHPNYWAVFMALVVLTTVSFITVTETWQQYLGANSGPIVVMVVAVCKATLVAMYFMHLKFDWFKVYVMIVPVLLLGTILVCALLPDMTFAQDIKWAGLAMD